MGQKRAKRPAEVRGKRPTVITESGPPSLISFSFPSFPSPSPLKSPLFLECTLHIQAGGTTTPPLPRFLGPPRPPPSPRFEPIALAPPLPPPSTSPLERERPTPSPTRRRTAREEPRCPPSSTSGTVARPPQPTSTRLLRPPASSASCPPSPHPDPPEHGPKRADSNRPARVPPTSQAELGHFGKLPPCRGEHGRVARGGSLEVVGAGAERYVSSRSPTMSRVM